MRLTNKKSLVENVEVIQRVNVGSDHRLIRGTIKPNPRLERSRMIRSGKPKINIGGLLLKKGSSNCDFKTALKC